MPHVTIKISVLEHILFTCFECKTYHSTFVVASRRGKLSKKLRGFLDSVDLEFALTAKISVVGEIMCFLPLSEVSTGLVALYIMKFRDCNNVLRYTISTVSTKLLQFLYETAPIQRKDGV